MSTRIRLARLVALGLFAAGALLGAVSFGISESTADAGAEALDPGLRLLLEQPLSISALTVDELDDLWEVWQGAERAAAEAATAEDRRRQIYARYGLIERGPGLGPEAESSLPLGYTADSAGNLHPNCLACHGGRVAGKVVPGVANNEQDLVALVTDLAALRAARSGGEGFDLRGVLSLFPLNFTRGSTNATMYSILLGSMRDEHLEQVMPPRMTQVYVHNTIDAPAWWQFQRKERIYWDGMAPKTTRTLMQFTMGPGLSGEKIRGWEDEFEIIRDYISSLEAPAYPFEIDHELAASGRVAFERVCSRCHGTYGAGREDPENEYPNKTVPINEIGTDPVRHSAIKPESKAKYNQSWFSNYGEHPVIVETAGYVAPPLDGVWATAPYLHNGSVPTLWHMLRPAARPDLWRRLDPEGYDQDRVGLVVEELDQIPEDLDDRRRREIYDTGRASQSAGGHLFPEKLTEPERRAVLEYLKGL